MTRDRVGHAVTKFVAQTALRAAIRAGRLPCEMPPNGLSVRVDDRTGFEPDALVHGGARLDPDATTVSEPLIIVEVLSPSTKPVDPGFKFQGYFRLPSVQHDLILDTGRRTVIHHRRGAGELIETRIAASGELFLDPPGLTIGVGGLFAEP